MGQEAPRIFTLSFPLTPTPYTRVGYNRYGKAYVPSKEKKFRTDLALLAKKQFKIDPIKSAIKLEIIFQFIKGPQSRMGNFVSKRPDIDNLSKSCMDSLNNILWHDDCQIIELHAKKIFGPEESITLQVEELI